MFNVCAEIVKDPERFDYEETDAKGRKNRFKFIKGLGVIAYNEGSV